MKFEPRKMKFYGIRDIEKLPQLQNLPEERRFEMKVVASVLPMRSNNYVVEDLINWDSIPADPIYQLTFMQKGMLKEDHFDRVAKVHQNGGDKAKIKEVVEEVIAGKSKW